MKQAKKRFSALGWLKANYHWVVAAAALLVIFVHSGAGNNLNALHMIPVSEELGIERADYSAAFLFKTVTAMVSTFFSGFFFSRFGSRPLIAIGLFITAASYFVLSAVNSYGMLILGGALLGLSYGFCATSGSAQIVRTWFHRHEGTVLGLLSASSGIGGSVMCIIQTAAMESHGFRGSYFVCAVAMVITGILCVLLIRNRPEDKGLLPLGDGEEIVQRSKKIANRAHPGFAMKRLWTRPSFYLMIFATFLSCMCVYMVFSVFRSYLVDCGFSSASAGGLQSAMMLLLTGTKFLTGIVSDWIGPRKVNLLLCAFAVVSLLSLLLVGNFASALVAMILYTLSLPMVTIITPLLAYSLFGYRAQAQYTGIFIAVINVSSFLGEYLSNVIYGAALSYRPAFLLAALLAAVCIPLFLLLYRLCDRDRKLSEQDAEAELA
jgi:sugar phosphate permease